METKVIASVVDSERQRAVAEMGLCSSCKKYSVCSTLCPEAELNINQDQRDWGDTPSVYFDQDGRELRVFDPVRGRDSSYLSPREKKVLALLAAGNERVKVASMLGISRVELRKVIMRLRKKTAELEKC